MLFSNRQGIGQTFFLHIARATDFFRPLFATALLRTSFEPRRRKKDCLVRSTTCSRLLPKIYLGLSAQDRPPGSAKTDTMPVVTQDTSAPFRQALERVLSLRPREGAFELAPLAVVARSAGFGFDLEDHATDTNDSHGITGLYRRRPVRQGPPRCVLDSDGALGGNIGDGFPHLPDHPRPPNRG